MPNDHFGMPFVISFYRIIWKIIVQILEEAHNYFDRDRAMDFTYIIYGCLLTRPRSIYI